VRARGPAGRSLSLASGGGGSSNASSALNGMSPPLSKLHREASARLRRGALLGEMALLGAQRRELAAVATTECVVWCLRRATYLELLLNVGGVGTRAATFAVTVRPRAEQPVRLLRARVRTHTRCAC
jgi:CRP-like cAMP-binding protein